MNSGTGDVSVQLSGADPGASVLLFSRRTAATSTTDQSPYLLFTVIQ